MTTHGEDAFEPASAFVLRAPLLPLDALVAFSSGLHAPDAADEALEDALAHDRALLFGRLREALREPTFREAIFCASPSLDDAVRGWLASPPTSAASNVPPIVVRYFARMCARATPFGLFSSCGAGPVGTGETTLSIAEAPVVRHTRLDMQYLAGLVEALDRDPAVRAALRYAPSNGMSRIGDQIHHAEAELRGEPKTRAFRLVSLDASASLDVALQCARGGARLDEIAEAVLRAEPDVGAQAARDFVEELVDSQILVSELSPPLTGREPIHHVIDVLRERGVGEQVVATLERTRDRLTAMDREGLGSGDASYRAIAEELRPLGGHVELARLFQIDLVRSARGSLLGRRVVEEVRRAVALFRRIAVPAQAGELEAFTKAFRERYESREVPLCEALDDEVGVGFGRTSAVPSSLLDGLPLPEATGSPPQVSWGAP